MALTATTTATVDALDRLADRFAPISMKRQRGMTEPRRSTNAGPR
jgi:hypothetical protein